MLRGPLIIGRDHRDNRLVPRAEHLHRRTLRIKGCRIEDSMIMEDTRLEDLHWPIVKSMIGRHVELIGGSTPARELLASTLGDHSRIEMPDG